MGTPQSDQGLFYPSLSSYIIDTKEGKKERKKGGRARVEFCLKFLEALVGRIRKESPPPLLRKKNQYENGENERTKE